MLAPVVPKQLDHWPVKNLNGQLQHAKQILATPGPAVAQEEVVLLLDPNSRQSPQHIQMVRQFLELNEVQIPGTLLALANRLQGNGGIAVAASRIVEQ